MIITRSWINEWVDISKISSDEIVKKLNSIGLEVAEYKKIDIPSKVVVGKVIECEKHPNADKLSVCKVDVGSEKLQIVCGAKNVAAGQFVAVAVIGAVLPGDFKIKQAKLRGVESYGMICSSTELGLPKLEDGIMVLDESIGELQLGKELKEYGILNDELIEIELTANRGDCLSIYGIARELSCAFDLPLKSPEDIYFEKKEKMQLGIGRVLNLQHQNDIDANLIYKVFSNSEFDIPLKIRVRLAFIDENFENRLENISFYTTYTTGTILRAYGYEIFKSDDIAKIEVKKDENGLDAVYDTKKISLVGINQIEESKPKDDEKYFIVEASYIDPVVLSKRFHEVSKKRKIDTDWVYYRSSRGSNPDLKFGIDYFCYLVRKYSDIDIFSGSHEIVKEIQEKNVNVNLENLNRLIGQEISQNSIVSILSKLGFEVIKKEEENIVVKVPTFRHDIENDQDIAEECIRFIGIDNILPKPFEFEEKNRINEAYFDFKKRKNLRERAVAAGFYETTNYIFTNKDNLLDYGFKTVKEELDLINPITKELNTLRTSLIPGLLEQTIYNFKNGKRVIRLFEIGTVFDENRNESIKIGFIYSGFKEMDFISNHGKPEFIDFSEFVKNISKVIGDFELKKSEPFNNLSHPYQCASIFKDGKKLGEIYKLHLMYQKGFDIPPTYICELDFDSIESEFKEAQAYSKFQIAFRDLSVLIDKEIEFSKIKDLLKDVLPKEIKRFYPVDIYESEKLGDKKSLTIRFMIQSDEKTLSEDEISELLQKVLDILKESIGAELR